MGFRPHSVRDRPHLDGEEVSIRFLSIAVSLLVSFVLAGEPVLPFRGNPALTGQFPSIPSPPYALRWTFRTNGMLKSSPVVASDRVIFGSRDGHIYAVDLATGKKLWSHKAGDEVDASPLVVGNSVFIGVADGTFLALRVLDGAVLWSYKTEDRILGAANRISLPDDKIGVLVGSYDMFLHCLDAETGAVVWKQETENFINGTPAVANGRIVFGGCDGMLRILETNGSEKLAVDAGSHIASSPAVMNNTAYVGQYAGAVLAINLETGKTLWNHGGAGQAEPFLAPPAVDKTRLFIGSRDKSMHCLDRATGTPIWTFRTRGQIEGGVAIGSGLALFGSADGRIYAIDASTGKRKGSFDIGAPISSSPTPIEDTILVSAEDGRLYALAPRDDN